MNTFQLLVNSINTRSNIIGAFASGLCLIHCVATPLLFVAAAHHHDHHDHHHHDMGIWGSLDFIFLAIAMIAVFFSAQNSSLKWMRVALYASLAILTFLIVNERLGWVHLPHELIYIPTLSLIGFHIYNRRYCNCEDDECGVKA